ncbi:MAG TPA: tetratricopeptide repeat protein [Tepidisphaeraceae bacterium]|nr:tetratricopeptide repeat protein [Tepidisphaeraceae bacterium]
MPGFTIDDLFRLATQQHQAGKLSEAAVTYQQILSQQNDHADALHMLGVLLHQTGRHAEAVQLIRRAIALNPTAAHFHLNCGLAMASLRRFEDAIESFQQAAALRPDFAEAYFNLGRASLEARLFDAAIAAYRRAIELRPQHAEAHFSLGCALDAGGHPHEAISEYQQSVALRPDFPEAWFNLANALRSAGRRNQAIDTYRQALARRPDFLEATHNLAITLTESGQFRQAMEIFKQILPRASQSVTLLINYGNALRAAGRFQKAIDVYRRALLLQPNAADAHAFLGTALRDSGQLDEAIASFRKALDLAPTHSVALNNLGNTLREAGLVEEGIECYRRSLAVKRDPVVASNLLAALYSHPDYDSKRLYQEHARWNETYARPLSPFICPHPNDRSPDRRLRIGYVSPDLNGGPIGRFLTPLLAHHDHQAFQIFCYSDIFQPDEITRQLQSNADVWRNTGSLSHESLAELIRSDAIDILVDLSLHGRGNRLLTFARKPAPVQVSYLAYCGTTGLDTMDYRFSDPYLDPPGTDDSCYSEKTLRLAQTYWCYPAPDDAQAVGPLPAHQAGYVTFGCLNNFYKVTPAVLETWRRIMQASPGSHLVLHAREGSHRDRVARYLSEQEISSDRLRFVGFLSRADYFAQYQQIDIALDPFPFPGGTTTCDALWSGVPVVSLAGITAMSRAGLSILSNVGLGELVARDQDQYVNIATDLASDLPRLDELRSSLRPRMAASPLMDGRGFARDVESRYRTIWQKWVERNRS